MDRPVKERLVGASILAALIVLIVPELLPGPAPGPGGPRLPVSTPEPVRNVTVDLATSKAPAAEEAVASNVDAADTQSAASSLPPAPRPSASTPSAAGSASPSGPSGSSLTASGPASPVAAPSPQASSQSAPPREAPSTPLETASPPPTVVPGRAANGGATAAIQGHAWAVQLGSFASHANAEKLVRQMQAQGFAVYVLSGGRGSSLRYRVRIGPMADRGAAAQVVAKLKAAGHIGSLVPPAP